MALGNSCHGSTSYSNPGEQQTLALLGMPNTGKSTLYNRLTGGNALIANWPGFTVELRRGPLPPGAGGQSRQLVDLPGIHDLDGHSADEAVVKDFLYQTPPDLVLVIVNASQIAAQLRLVLQVLALGLPTVLALNMSDEARRQPEQLVHWRTRRLDRWLLYPFTGVLLFLGIVLLLFQSLYALAKPLQDLLGSGLDWLQTVLLEPGLTAIGAPEFLRGFLVDGVWLGVGTITTFLPVIFLFYLMLAVIEDSGYLPRAAFLMDGFMNWLGLDGRAFVLQVI